MLRGMLQWQKSPDLWLCVGPGVCGSWRGSERVLGVCVGPGVGLGVGAGVRAGCRRGGAGGDRGRRGRALRRAVSCGESLPYSDPGSFAIQQKRMEERETRGLCRSA